MKLINQSKVNHAAIKTFFEADTFQPTHDFVFAEKITDEASPIFLPDSVREQSQTCIVRAVGPGRWMDSGFLRPVPCKVGDRVFTTPNSGYVVKVGGHTYALFDAAEILGVFPEHAPLPVGADEL